MCQNSSTAHTDFEKFLALRYFVWIFSSMLKSLVCYLWLICHSNIFRLEPLLYWVCKVLSDSTGLENISGLGTFIYLHPCVWQYFLSLGFDGLTCEEALVALNEMGSWMHECKPTLKNMMQSLKSLLLFLSTHFLKRWQYHSLQITFNTKENFIPMAEG